MATITFDTLSEATKVYDTIKIIAENEEQVEEFWNKISKKSFDDVKKQFKKKTPRGKTAYQIYSSSKDVQDKLSEGKKLTIGQMSTLVSQSWSSLSKEEQSVYEKQALEYNTEHNLLPVVKAKKPKSAFLLFCDDERPSLIDEAKKNLKKGEKFNLGQVQKQLGNKWKELSKEQKEKYQTKAKLLKESVSETTEVPVETTTEQPIESSVPEETPKKKKKKTTTKK